MTTSKKKQSLEITPNIRITRPRSIRETVRDTIRNDIYDGRIIPGMRFSEARLAKQINTSRTPVREALHMLEMEGLLESIPRVGYQVKPVNWDELEQLSEIRFVNEALATKWAMDRMTPREFESLEEIIRNSKIDIDNGDHKKFWFRDAQFHETIARYSGNKRLMEMCKTLRHQMIRYHMQTIHIKEFLFKDITVRAVQDHQQIFECMCRKDHQSAKTALQKHLNAAKKHLMSYVFGNDKSG